MKFVVRLDPRVTVSTHILGPLVEVDKSSMQAASRECVHEMFLPVRDSSSWEEGRESYICVCGGSILADSPVLISIPTVRRVQCMPPAGSQASRKAECLFLLRLHLNAHLFNTRLSILIDVVYLCLFNQPIGGGCNEPLRQLLLLLVLH